jgi:hypothetical protein
VVEQRMGNADFLGQVARLSVKSAFRKELDGPLNDLFLPGFQTHPLMGSGFGGFAGFPGTI